MKNNYYQEMIGRNIGIFSESEQHKISELTIGIAGVGGVGGIATERLVRMGVGHIKIADSDIFESSNLNRQFGSTSATLGKNKAKEIALIMSQINPSLILDVYEDGINEKTVEEFVTNCDFIIDGIDYNAFECTVLLHQVARKQKKFILNPHAIGFGISLLFFNPDGMSIWNYLEIDGALSRDQLKEVKLPAEKICPTMPSYIKKEIVQKVLKKEMYIPTVSVGPAMAGSYAAMMTILFLLNKKKFPFVPEIINFDFF
jgi:molybdopterin/thiamine biosynthesis adenylyltransferase